MSISTLQNLLTKDFSMIPNRVIIDKRLSDRAKVVFLYLASKQDGWKVYNKDIMNKLNIKTNQTMADVWRCLIDTGWVTRKQQTGTNGKFSGVYNYILNPFPSSSDIDINLDYSEPDCGKTVIRENRNTEKPVYGENNKHTNTNTISNTNSNKEKNIKKEKPGINFDFKDFNEPEVFSIKKWLDYRKEIRKPYKTQYALDQLRKKLLGLMECNQLIEAIDHSRGKEWQDIFPPTDKRYPKELNQKQELKEAIKNCNENDFSCEVL